MIPIRPRFLLTLTLVFLIAACSALPKLPEAHPPADELFLQALGEISAATPGAALDMLRRDYPDSPWTASAQSINELQQAHDAQEARIRSLQQEKNRLLQENRKLKEDMEKLRKLVIETERRRR